MAKNKNYPPEGFTERLKELYMKSGMTQKHVAEEIGYERKSVLAWVNGACMPDIVALTRLCRLFNVSADYLLFGEEKEHEVHTP